MDRNCHYLIGSIKLSLIGKAKAIEWKGIIIMPIEILWVIIAIMKGHLGIIIILIAQVINDATHTNILLLIITNLPTLDNQQITTYSKISHY